MESDFYHSATMLIPQFKLNYLDAEQRLLKRALLVQAVNLINKNGENHQTETVSSTVSQYAEKER
jgi:hypothetical protein